MAEHHLKKAVIKMMSAFVGLTRFSSKLSVYGLAIKQTSITFLYG